MDKRFIQPLKSPVKSFTLVELIIVVIIVGILASLGLTQYSEIVEKSRTAEARVRIGTMRDLAYSYYLENGSFSGMTLADAGVNGACSSTDFYSYTVWNYTTLADFVAIRCTNGGKAPNASLSYYFWFRFIPSTGAGVWHCYYLDGNKTPCFGFPGD